MFHSKQTVKLKNNCYSIFNNISPHLLIWNVPNRQNWVNYNIHVYLNIDVALRRCFCMNVIEKLVYFFFYLKKWSSYKLLLLQWASPIHVSPWKKEVFLVYLTFIHYIYLIFSYFSLKPTSFKIESSSEVH